ncbi:L,D-transpeptidase family protein [[Clostridium] dakarense]|uniref:L,D-transpeptidase family protein n=1 Tax=Faecalimicrobium dakarense TaxID=1301100 RepID=UPI0004B12999|nr:L,D-transpeptidase family protein [[Clostridium] dakarense]
MKKKIRKCMVFLITACLIFSWSIGVSEAASNHLIIINTKTNKMGYYVNNKFVKEFRVATGKKSTPTPQGKSKIVNKIKNRPYYSGGIPGGDPRNPLGDRWLGLQLKGTYGTTYGIHGNNNESSIGKSVSGGCIRMHNKDVRWLFDQVTTGTDVILKSTNESYKQIAARYNIKLYDKGENPAPPIKTGWQIIDNKKYYYDSKGKKVTGWQTISSKKYYFDGSGVMQTGFKTVDNKTYYLGNDGIMRSGWQTINNNRYYFNSDGEMQKGWQTINNNKYYFDNDGVMQKGWKTIDGKKILPKIRWSISSRSSKCRW